MKRNKLALALAGLLIAPIAGTASAQSAPTDQATPQSQPSPTTNSKQLQTVVVTGSSIPRIDAETSSPVTVITAQQIARSGYTTISDVVRSISADNSDSIPNAFGNGFAAGASGVALRGLTVNSTLVLIDGHRSADYPVSDDGERSFVDLNTIPIAAVERVEVLKDGASSLYGADAIAGVVNVILKPDFHGVEATADIGTSQKGGASPRREPSPPAAVIWIPIITTPISARSMRRTMRFKSVRAAFLTTRLTLRASAARIIWAAILR
ncbi:MAG: TonB-dependent receptor plug domain-containing protein [Rhodanobacter sp.]